MAPRNPGDDGAPQAGRPQPKAGPSPSGTASATAVTGWPVLRWVRSGKVIRSWRARVGIENETLEQPIRITVTPTLGGAQIDHWGPGIARLQLSGQSGWGYPWGNPGEANYEALKDLVAAYENSVAENPKPQTELIEYVNEHTGTFCQCVLGEAGLTLRRSASQPLAKRWELSLIVVRDMRRPKPARTIAPFLDKGGTTVPSAGTVAGDAGSAKTSPVSSNPAPDQALPGHVGQGGR